MLLLLLSSCPTAATLLQMAVVPIGGITPVILAAIKSINGDVHMTIVPWLAACAAVSLVSTAVLYRRYPQSNRDIKGC